MFVANLQCNTIYLTLLSLFDIYVFQNLCEITHFKLSVSTMWAFLQNLQNLPSMFVRHKLLPLNLLWTSTLKPTWLEWSLSPSQIKFLWNLSCDSIFILRKKKENINGQTKDYPYIKIGICCFSAKHATLRRKNKDWLARNHDNVSWVGWYVCPQTIISVS